MEYQLKGVHCQVQSIRHLRGTGQVAIMRIMELLVVAGYIQSIEESNEMLKSLITNLRQNVKDKYPP